MLKIDFGSGYNPYPGYKTCDITQGPYLDYVYNTETNEIIGLQEGSTEGDSVSPQIFKIRRNSANY